MEFGVSEAWYRATGGGDGEIVLVTTLHNVSGPPNYDHDQNRYHTLEVDDFPSDDEFLLHQRAAQRQPRPAE